MVPTLIMGGVILAFSQLLLIAGLKFLLISASWMLLIGEILRFRPLLTEICLVVAVLGGVLFGFAIPMFAAFVANSMVANWRSRLVLSVG